MKTYNERTESIKVKVKNKRQKRTIIWTSAVTAGMLIALTVFCSLPIFGEGVPSINAYKGDSYFPIIQKINEHYQSDKHSIFDTIKDSFPIKSEGTGLPTAPAPGDSSQDNSSAGNRHEETTLNQVDGVAEGDLLKRSKTHAFYIQSDYADSLETCLRLKVYELAGVDTEKVSEYRIRAKDETNFGAWYSSSIYNAEMFLSDDACRLTVITSCRSKYNVGFTTVISLDVSDVNNIVEVNRVYVSGRYLSSRIVDGKLLVITNFYVGRRGNYYGTVDVDYSKKETYIPQCGSTLNGGFIPMDNIRVPVNCGSINYTVLALLDEESLEVKDRYAVFSYTDEVYVSRDYLVVMRNVNYYYDGQFEYGKEVSVRNDSNYKRLINARVCEMVAIKYSDSFEMTGEIGIEGNIKDRYSVDEKDGILRVFTTVNSAQIYNKNDNMIYGPDPNPINVSLYCVDLTTMKVAASKECFAPSGDEVKSARFDGDTAYVCTARSNIDPVFRFDLSDLNNITYIDSGEIDGFSTNLIKFNDLLLGIGQGTASWSVKIELYQESGDLEAENGIISVAKYERQGQCSQEYKAHFIDAEHNLIGLQIWDYESVSHDKYLLLHYDVETNTLQQIYLNQFDSDYDYTRAFYKDNGVYVFGTKDFKFIAV